jgi:AraC-like DNA-binding protein
MLDRHSRLAGMGNAMERPSTSRGRGSRPLTEKMRRVLRVELIREGCTADTIARLFSVSRRTLLRHLHAEGCTSRQVVNEVRVEIACMLLAKTDLPLKQIAEGLNYAAPSAFTRAFQRWSGQAPSTWRRSHRRRAG